MKTSVPNRIVTIVVAHPVEESAEQLVECWRTTLERMGQQPNVRSAYNVDCLVNLALHGGTFGSEADVVVLAGHFNPSWKLPRGRVVSNANPLQDHLRSCGFRRNLVVIADDLSAFCDEHFNGLWPFGQFTASPQKFRAKIGELLGL